MWIKLVHKSLCSHYRDQLDPDEYLVRILKMIWIKSLRVKVALEMIWEAIETLIRRADGSLQCLLGNQQLAKCSERALS